MVERLKNYVSEAYNELMFKVSWPTWGELQSSALVVAVAALIISLFVFLMDKGSSLTLSTFYKLF